MSTSFKGDGSINFAKNLGLRNRLILAFFIVVLIPLLGFGLFLDSMVEKQTKQDFVEATTREVVQVDNAISIFFDGLMQNTRMLATEPLARQTDGKISVYINKEAGSDGMIPMTPIQNGGYEAELYRMFEQFGANHPQVSVVSFGTSDGGYLQWPAVPRKKGYDSRARDWYKETVTTPDKAVLSDPFMTSKGVPTIGIFSTVKDNDNNLRGVIGLNVDLPAITQMIQNIKIGKSGYVILLDSKGTIIADPKHTELNFKHVKELQVEKLGKVNEIDKASFNINLDGADQLATVYTSPKTGWKYIILVEKAQLLESVSKIRQAMLMAVLIALIIIAIVAYFIAGQMASPLKLLENVANRIAKGDIRETELAVKSNDELGRLAGVFAAMSKQLRTLITNINKSAEQVLVSSGELTAAAEQSAQAVTNVAGAIGEVATASESQLTEVDRMVNTVKQISDRLTTVAHNTQNMSQSADQTGQAALSGKQAIERAVDQMGRIESTVTDSAAVVSELGERSKVIGNIVETISNIAGQTNLLALNAAIEAARAGEQGKGFAVVAEEVRKLAEQSQAAAKQIAALIGDVQNDTAKAVNAMTIGTQEVKLGSDVVDTAGKQFAEITALIGQVRSYAKAAADETEKVADDSRTIVSAIEKIDSATKKIAADIETISAATQQQSASMEQISASSNGLSTMADELKTAVRQFKC